MENQEKVFTCQVSGGNPTATKVAWYLEDVLLQEKRIIDNGQTLVAQINSDWQGKLLKCSVTQSDIFDNEIVTKDERTVSVVSIQQSRNLKGITTKRGQFASRGTYPASGSILIGKLHE